MRGERPTHATAIAIALFACAPEPSIPDAPPPLRVSTGATSASPPPPSSRAVPVKIELAPRMTDVDLLTPDESRAVLPVRLTPGGACGLVVRALAGDLGARFIPTGSTDPTVVEVSAHDAVVFQEEAKTAAVVDLDTGELRAFTAVIAPAFAGRDPISVDEKGRVARVDRERGKRRWTADAGLRIASDSTPTLEVAASGARIAASDASQTIVIDAETGALLFRTSIGAAVEGRPALSPKGRYLTRAVTEGGTIRAVLLDTQTGTRVAWSEASDFMIPASAVSRDETLFVSAASGSTVIAQRLPSGERRRLKTRLRDDAVTRYVVDEIGITDDGARVCGHPLVIERPSGSTKYTPCDAQLLAELSPSKRLDRGQERRCYVSGGRARVVTVPSSPTPSRTVPSSVSATYTRVCNSAIADDGSVVGLLEVAHDQSGDDATAADFAVIDAASGAVVQRIELGPGPLGMGSAFQADFGPGGHVVALAWGSDMSGTFDVKRGVKVTEAIDLRFSRGGHFMFSESHWIDLRDGKTIDWDLTSPVCLRGMDLVPVERSDSRCEAR